MAARSKLHAWSLITVHSPVGLAPAPAAGCRRQANRKASPEGRVKRSNGCLARGAPLGFGLPCDRFPIHTGRCGPMSDASRRNPLLWIPSLYLAEGLPYVVVMTVSVIMYKGFGISNTDIAYFTSWLYLPWVIKPLWSPVVDLLGTRRRWIWVTQLVVGAALAGAALSIPAPQFFRWTLVFFWLLAFDSATHDIAADGFYMLATTERQQAFFVGVRSMFYRLATIAGQGLLVMLAGAIQGRTGDLRLGWSVAFGGLAVLFLGFGLWHRFVLPRPPVDRPGEAREIPHFVQAFLATFGSFFRKPRIVVLLLFLTLYRFGEAQLVKLVAPYLLDSRAEGGLAL